MDSPAVTGFRQISDFSVLFDGESARISKEMPGDGLFTVRNIQEWNNVKNPGEIKPKTILKSTILANFRFFKGSEKIPHFADFFLSNQ